MVDLSLNNKGFLLLDTCIAIIILVLLTNITLMVVNSRYQNDNIEGNLNIEMEATYEAILLE